MLACASLLLAVSAMAHGSKVGFVNPQRIINESKIGRIAQEDLERLGQEKDRRVRVAMKDVENLRARLERETLTLSERELGERELRLAVEVYEKMVKVSNLEIQAEEQRLIKFVMRRADSILQAIAKQNGFTMILTDPEIIGFVENSMDITDQVINQLNSMI